MVPFFVELYQAGEPDLDPVIPDSCLAQMGRSLRRIDAVGD